MRHRFGVSDDAIDIANMSFGAPKLDRRRWETIPPNPSTRLNIYLGYLAGISNVTFELKGADRVYICRKGMDFAAFEASLSRYSAGRSGRGVPLNSATKHHFDRYIKPLIELADEIGTDRPFLVRPGDNTEAFRVPTFCKSRPANAPGFCIIEKLNVPRHWDAVARVEDCDRPFREKERRLVWRGATTGCFVAPLGTTEETARAFVPRFNAGNRTAAIDIGYSRHSERFSVPDPAVAAAVAKNVKGPLSLKEQLESRYLLSLEGNDVASGLKWMLHSNSCVLMPQPAFQTWACEQRLKPFVHYVPVRPDLADLEEAFAWCLANEDVCEQIAENGTRFIRPFLKKARERALMLEVFAETLKRVTLKRTDGADIDPDML